MQHNLTKISFLVTFISIGLLLVLAEIQAQQSTPATVATATSKSLTIDALKNRRAAIDKMTDIDATLKAESLKFLDNAMADLKLADGFNTKAQNLSQQIKTAPGRLKILRQELRKPLPTIEQIKNKAQQMDTAALEQKRNLEEADLAKEKGKLQELNDRLTTENNTINQASEKMVDATRRLNELQADLTTLNDVAEDDIGNYTRMLSLQSERQKLRAESEFNELRKQSHNLLVELFGMEIDVAQKAVQSRSTLLTVWQAEIQQRRQQEAAQTRQDAQDAMGLTQTLPKMIQDQFDLNIELSTELEEITREEAALIRWYEDYQARLNALETDLATTKKRFELTELTEAMGLTMRQKRLNLPSADLYMADVEARESRMSEISEKLIDLDEMLREFSSPAALVQRLVGSVSFLSDVDRQSFDLKIQELIANRIEILEKLKSGYNRIFRLLQDIEFTTQTIVVTTKNFGEFLDRHLLWVRSSKTLSPTDLLNLNKALGWFFGPDGWRQNWQDLRRSLQRHWFLWSIGIIIALVLVLARQREVGKISEINASVQQQPLQDSISLTLKVLGLTVLLASVWPFIMAFPAFMITKLAQTQPHTRGAAGGLLEAAKSLFVLGLAYHICRKDGLAQVHFRWNESVRKTLRQNLNWSIPIIVGFSFIVAGMAEIPEIESGDVLAKIALVVISAATAIFFARILRFKGGITSLLIQKYPKNWLTRLRYVWYPLMIAVPVVTIYLAVQGYYYSALEIHHLIRLTAALAFGLVVFNALVLRLLMLSRRQLALKKARLAQQLLKEKSSGQDSDSTTATTDAEPSPLMQSTIDMGTIDDQTRALIKTVIFILTVAGLWNIWAPVFPALGNLLNVKVWSYTAVIDGVSQLQAITLADVVVGVIIITITIIAVRNLPGLLEMILLNRLPLDPGARYAYAAISRYTLTAVGVFIALNTLGIRWSSLQWLVAALGVGIGFGLQEIIANFICGLIILFERPIRVGDIVTVGTTDGVVTKIRIRATTIRGWDRKELLVPNKEFITTRLLNWSLSDQMTRILVTVGVAYGSDVDKAMALMREAAEEHELVLDDPEPTVSFDMFGDNALTLTLRAYLASTDYRVATTTDLNKAINQKFADAGIEISFPQRDVHLDTKGPLDVRVVSEPSESKSDPRSTAASDDADV